MKGTALITVALSGAAIVGYVSYRMLLPPPEPAGQAPAGPTDAAAEAPAPPREAAETLPEFTLAALDGGRRSILDWPDRALVINFWATWCAPCLREIPLLKEFQTARGDERIQVIGIAVDGMEPVRSFAEKMQFNYPVLVGQSEGMEAAASFGVDFFALPFTVFTDAEGNVLGVHTGELRAEDLDNVAGALAALEAGTIDLDEARARVAGRI